MAYHNDLFPLDIAYGARGGPMFNTTVLELASGYEKRNQNWQKVRARYNVTYGIRKPAQMTAFLNFFYARQGRAHSFPYLDPKDSDVENGQIGVGNGTTTVQIKKRYTSGGFYYDREITKLAPGTLAGVAVDGVPHVLGGGGADGVSVDELTGIMTFVTAPILGAAITCTYMKFYVHVRFDVDYADIQHVTYQAEAWPDIFLVEIKEDNT